ncbi:MAG: hypothetical protein JRI91_00190 [Deltaproteobacteria bacterium]|nr:hypothetical protein [Deltaproteobacteria bacterium]
MRKLLAFAIILFFMSNTHAGSNKYSDWHFQCIDKECKIFTYVEIPKTAKDGPEVHCYVLSVKANNDIILQEVFDVAFHRTMSPINIPVEYVIKNTETAVRQFHDAKGKKIILQFDKHNEISSTPSEAGVNYCVFKQQKAEKLIDLFRKKNKVVFIQKFIGLGFVYPIGQPYQKTKAVFSLKGFSKAYNKLISTSDSKTNVTRQQ